MAELDLKSIRDRANSATGGPWHAFPYFNEEDDEDPNCVGCDVQATWGDGTVLIVDMPNGRNECCHNAIFIAHARQDVPALLDRVEELEKEIAFWKSKHQHRKAINGTQRFRILHRDRFACVYCGARGGPETPLEIDHRVPVSKGGTNDDTNLCTACSECNRGKRDLQLTK